MVFSQNYGLYSRIDYGILYLGVPTWDPDLRNYPYEARRGLFFRVLGGGCGAFEGPGCGIQLPV